MRRLEIHPVLGVPEVREGDDLVALLIQGLKRTGLRLRGGDVVVVKQKVVSKSEGRVVELGTVRPSRRAKALATQQGKDPRLVHLILGEARRVVRAGHGVIITETRLGFVCANSGVDLSNVKPGHAALLPRDPDSSAKRIRSALEQRSGLRLAVVITDTFGRPWRRGQTDVAVGCSGIEPLRSYVGSRDRFGYNLRVTEPATVDEIAGAAELVAGKLSGVPFAVVRGLDYRPSEAGVKSIILARRKDLFR